MQVLSHISLNLLVKWETDCCSIMKRVQAYMEIEYIRQKQSLYKGGAKCVCRVQMKSGKKIWIYCAFFAYAVWLNDDH